MPTENEEVEDLTTDETEEVEEDEVEDEEYTPPTKEEYARLQAQLKKVNAESKKHRLAAKAARETPAAADDDAVAAARKEAEDKYRPMVVKAAIREGLASSGLIGDPARALKLIDYDSLEIDDDGTVNSDDLEDAISGLKTDYPELFKKSRPGAVDNGRPATGREPKELSPSERQALQALRK